MRIQRTKSSESWRCRREQYLRESGRYLELTREGYTHAEPATSWIVVVGGRGLLERAPKRRLFLVKKALRETTEEPANGSA